MKHTAANVDDSMTLFKQMVDAIAPIRQPRGRPRKRPQELHADEAYDDARKCPKALRRRGIEASIARKGEKSSEKLEWYRGG